MTMEHSPANPHDPGELLRQRPAYAPVRLDAVLDSPSRWLWLFKWLLVIPHVIVLVFLWIAFFVVTIIAFFAILFTARYPRALFNFNVGVMRWTWRVGYYSYHGLGTDKYPPFSLQDRPDYPARLDIAYPERLSRGLVLVKWWLLAIPHHIILVVFFGSNDNYATRREIEHQTANATSSAASSSAQWMWDVPTFPGLIVVAILIVAIGLLFTGRYLPGLFNLVVGMNRWSYRVGAYVSLMTDTYPPFRLDQGGVDPATAQQPIASGGAAGEGGAGQAAPPVGTP